MALALQGLQGDLYRAKEGPLRQWIESRLAIKLTGARLADDLSDGTVLCQLMMGVKEGSIPRINAPGKGAFKQKENIIFFTSALEEYGIFRKRIFEVNDLFDRKNIPKVIDCLEEFRDLVAAQEREKELEKAKATAALYEAITPRNRPSARADPLSSGALPPTAVTLAVPGAVPAVAVTAPTTAASLTPAQPPSARSTPTPAVPSPAPVPPVSALPAKAAEITVSASAPPAVSGALTSSSTLSTSSTSSASSSPVVPHATPTKSAPSKPASVDEPEAVTPPRASPVTPISTSPLADSRTPTSPPPIVSPKPQRNAPATGAALTASASASPAPTSSSSNTPSPSPLTSSAAQVPPAVPPKPVRTGGSRIAEPAPPSQLHDSEVYIPSPEGSDDDAPAAQTSTKPSPPKKGSAIERPDSSPGPRKEKREKKEKKEKRDKEREEREKEREREALREAALQQEKEAAAQREKEAAAQREREAAAQREKEAAAQREKEAQLKREKEAQAQRERERDIERREAERKRSMLEAPIQASVSAPPLGKVTKPPMSARDDWVDSDEERKSARKKDSGVPIDTVTNTSPAVTQPSSAVPTVSVNAPPERTATPEEERKDKKKKKERDQSPLAVSTTRKSSHHRSASSDLAMSEKRHSIGGDPRKELKEKKHRRPKRPVVVLDRDPITGFAKLDQEPIQKVIKGIIRVQAWVRGHVARRRYTERVRAQAYRENVVKELLKTEVIYAKRLQTLINLYVRPLKKAVQDGNPIISSDDIKSIFSDVEIIVGYSLQLQADLTPVVEKFSASSRLGKQFKRFADFLKTYTGYVKNYNKALNLKMELFASNDRFSAFMQAVARSPESNNEAFEALLILPIQRVPRYELLLKELIKHTWADHADYADLTSSYEKIKDVAVFLNEGKRSAERMAKVFEVQNSIDKCEQLTGQADRYYVREAPLGLLYAMDEKRVDRHVFLFSDLLVMTTPHSSLLGLGGFLPFGGSSDAKSAAHRFNFDTTMRLNGCTVRDVQTNKQVPYALDILNKSDVPVITLIFPTAEIKHEWAADLHERCTDLATRAATLKPPAMSKTSTGGSSGTVVVTPPTGKSQLDKVQQQHGTHRRAKSINVASDVASRLSGLFHKD